MKKYIKKLINNGKYEEANIYMSTHITEKDYDDEVAIYDGVIGLAYGDGKRVWNACANGLTLNPRNYELYVILGEYYLSNNINQAYLCYENALFYCNKEKDREQIEGILSELKLNPEMTVRQASFIILSYNLLEYLTICIKSIRQMVPESAREIVVVDNGSEDGSIEWLKEQSDVVLVENGENLGFPKGCNVGIRVAKAENDIFLLNNDTLMTDNALFWLRMGLYESEKVGCTGSVSNYCGNLQRVAEHINDVNALRKYGLLNNVPKEHPYEEKLFLIGFALLIKRSVFNEVGFLDERFTPGNYEDNDYGLRVLEAGYKNVLCKNSFIIHFGSRTFVKAKYNYSDIMQVNALKFKEKWGIEPRYYFHPRKVLFELIEEPLDKEMKILDIGCGCGALIGHIKGSFPNAEVYGVEVEEKAFRFANYMCNAICGDVEKIDFTWEEETFDYVIMGDVLEHLERPDLFIAKIKKYIKKGGYILVSVPNVKHYSVMMPLLFCDEFTYSDSGILDVTHSKLYTRTEIKRLIESSGYVIRKMQYTTAGDPGEDINEAIDLLVELTGANDKETYLAYQYVVKAECV